MPCTKENEEQSPVLRSVENINRIMKALNSPSMIIYQEMAREFWEKAGMPEGVKRK